MKVPSSDIPQADNLASVVKVIEQVGKGAKTDEELIQDIPQLNTSRQGRYYRNAAETLGFVINQHNNASLTAKGTEFLKAPSINNPLFIAAILKIAIIQRIIPFLETRATGVTKSELTDYITAISVPVGPTVIPRRTSTIIAWLRDLAVIEEKGGKYYMTNIFTRHLPIMEVTEIEQPLFPVTGDLKEYVAVEERTAKASEMVTYYKDAAKLERASIAHQRLVNLVAHRISSAGGVAKSNALIDLATIMGSDFIFEMKSLDEGNMRSQIRKGISQLYEYRYIQNKQNAKLVLVLEKALPNPSKWMVDYLENDRGIHVIWDGDGKLHATSQTQKDLGFLKLR